MVKIIRAESEKTLMRKVKECFFSRNESSYALVMKEKNPLDSAFSVIHKVLRLGSDHNSSNEKNQGHPFQPTPLLCGIWRPGFAQKLSRRFT